MFLQHSVGEVAHTRLPSVGFRSWSRFLAASLQVTFCHKPGGRLPLLSARPAVTLATLKRAATNFAAWWIEARWVWAVCLRLLPDSVAAAIWTRAFYTTQCSCVLIQHSLLPYEINDLMWFEGRGPSDARDHVVSQRPACGHRQREPQFSSDAAAERTAVLPANHPPEERSVGRGSVPLQRHQPADRTQRRQQQRHPPDCRSAYARNFSPPPRTHHRRASI